MASLDTSKFSQSVLVLIPNTFNEIRNKVAKLYNLEWCTPSENARHAHNTLLNKTGKKIKVTNIINSKIETFTSVTSFSRSVNISLCKCRYSLKNNKLLDNLYRIKQF